MLEAEPEREGALRTDAGSGDADDLQRRIFFQRVRDRDATRIAEAIAREVALDQRVVVFEGPTQRDRRRAPYRVPRTIEELERTCVGGSDLSRPYLLGGAVLTWKRVPLRALVPVCSTASASASPPVT